MALHCFLCIIFHNMFYSFCLKRQNSWPPDDSALDALNDYTWQRHLVEKSCFKCKLYIKQITNIMKY